MSDAPNSQRPVLVLYVPANAPFVSGFLLPALGASAKGVPVMDALALETARTAELDAAMENHGVVIVVFTPAFLNDRWARLSDILATDAAVDRELAMVPVILEPCDVPPHVTPWMKLDCTDRAKWESEVERLRKDLERPLPVEPEPECPYPGMQAFSADKAKYFFGRRTEIAAMLALVAAGEREVYVIGPSGSGKSSLINAGVLPQLAAQPGGALVVRTMRPGDAPLAHLAECLEAAPGAAAPVAIDAAAVAAWAARHPGARLVVFVDQLEELFTEAPRGDRAGFAAALAALRGEPRCLLVLALRADFYAELMQSALWRDGVRHIDLPPLRGPALRDAIVEPARAVGVYFEAALIERLVDDAAGEPGVLPLLQATLVQLWAHRTRKLITLASYQALGEGGRSGLAVAISSSADRCLGALTVDQVVIARRLLLRLVSFGEGRPDTRRRQTRAQLAAGEAPAAFDAVYNRLLGARLITSDGDGGGAQVDLCHEVLITAWPAFARWAETYRADELRRRKIQASAEEWAARGRGDSGLLDDGELASAVAWRRTDAASALGETPEVTALIAASRDALDRTRRRRRGWIIAGFAGLAVFAAVTSTLALIARHQAQLAEAQRIEALHKLGEQYRDAGRHEVADGHPQRAVPYLIAARELGITGPALETLFHLATQAPVVLAVHHDGPVTAVKVTRDGRRIVTASRDRTARAWDASSGAPLTPPLRHARPVVAAALCGDGARFVTVSDDSTAWIWQLAAAPPPPIALRHGDRINTVECAGDGEVVVTASDDRTARLWNAHTGELLGAPFVHEARVITASLGAHGARLVTTVSEGTSGGIWDVAGGTRVAAVEDDDDVSGARHNQLVASAVFSADGARIATTSFDGTAMMWDAATGKPTARMVHAGSTSVDVAAFSPDGTQLVTADDAGRVWLWNGATGAAGRAIDGAHATALSYSHDGARLLVSGDDKRVRIYDARTGLLLLVIELESGMQDSTFTPDGDGVVTASFDGVARRWDTEAAMPRAIDTGDHRRYAAYSADGARIATSDDTGALRLWSAVGERQAELRPGLGALDLVFDRDGRQLAAIDRAGSVVFVDPATAAVHKLKTERGRNPTGGDDLREREGHVPPRGAFSPDGHWFATTAGPHAARIWDIAKGTPVAPALDHAAAVSTIRFSPDGARVITACNDGTARVWLAASSAPVARLDHPAEWVTSAAYSPDGRRIVTVATDNAVRLWNATSFALEATLTGHAGFVVAAAFSPDGTRLESHSSDHSVRIWDLATGELAVPPLEHAGRVADAAFSADGTRLVTVSDQYVQVWDVATGRALTAPLASAADAHSAVFHPDGNAVLGAARDGIRVWSIARARGTLAEWFWRARDGAFPQLTRAVDRSLPAQSP